MEAGQGVNSLNRCILMFGVFFGGVAPAGRGRKKYAKLEVGLAGRAGDADGTSARFIIGRASMTVFSIFSGTILTGDPGHPLCKVQNIFKYFSVQFTASHRNSPILGRAWDREAGSGRRMFGREAKQTSMVLNRPPVRRSMSKNLPPPKGRWRIGRAESHE